MNGTALYNLFVQILGDERPSQTLFLQLINNEKAILEMKRPWKVLSVVDNSQTVLGSNTYQTPFTLPADFVRLLGDSSLSEGSVVLYNAGANNFEYLTEIPIEQILMYKTNFGRVAVDYANGLFYITGVVPGSYAIYLYYIKFTDDITLLTSWTNFPARFHPILAYRAAARWRLGTDYDDVNARNADDNEAMAQRIEAAMFEWDQELALSAVNAIDYRGNSDGRLNGPRGIRARF